MIPKKSIFVIFTIFFMSCINLNILNNSNQLTDIKSECLENSAIEGNIDYLIITSEYFEPTLQPLATWKTQKGVVSKIEIISDIKQHYSGASLPEKIKNCIISYHNNNNTQWVLLAGDIDHVPTKYVVCDEGYPYDGDVVCCDSYYGDIDNDWSQENFDYEAEVYIGRLAANTRTEMNKLVQNILNYEKNPPIGEWMTHALFVGDILEYDMDWNHDNNLDFGECDGNRFNNYINNTLLPNNWSSYILAQTQGVKSTNYYSDAQIGYSNLKNAINQGCSISTIIAHGREYRMSISEWVTDYDGDMLFDYTANPWEGGGTTIDEMIWSTLFETSMTDLKEKEKLGIYYFGSCSVGTFDYTKDCVAEYFLKNLAIGCVAGSHLVWGEDQWYERDHGGWFIEGLGFRFWEQLFQYNQPGKALALAKADYSWDRSISPEPFEYSEWGNKTLKQFNLLGDPEVPIWLSIPEKLNVSIDQPYSNLTNTMTLIVTADKNPVEGALITYTENNKILWKGETYENGTIEVPFSQLEIDDLVFTASKSGFLPFQANLPQNTDLGSIGGYDIFGLSFTILSFMCITSIYFKHSLSKKKTK